MLGAINSVLTFISLCGCARGLEVNGFHPCFACLWQSWFDAQGVLRQDIGICVIGMYLLVNQFSLSQESMSLRYHKE